MFRKLTTIIIISIICILSSYASDVTSTATDSIRIEELLAKAAKLKKDENLMLFFGRQFIGIPYVAHTLDRNEEEKLVINTRELDCTTFVETVTSLTLCAKRGERTFSDYCRQLQRLRYKSGELSYVNRLHYFTSWIEDNVEMGYVEKVASKKVPFSAIQVLNINYMSKHSSAYSMLSKHKEWLPEILKTEKSLTGKKYRYIPKNAIKNTKLLRRTIHDGDIIAILTSKKGLDTSHIGIAVWHNDGLHLLNASQIYKKVVEDKTLFSVYTKNHPSQIGIRLCRVK